MNPDSKRQNVPKVTASRQRQVYFCPAEVECLAHDLKETLAHCDGGTAGAKILNRIANVFVLRQSFAKIDTPKTRAAWAQKAQAQAQKLLGTFDSGERPATWNPDLDCLRRIIEKDERYTRLAAEARIITRGAHPLGRVDGDPFPLVLRCIRYLRDFAGALEELESAEPKKPKSAEAGANELVGELADAFLAIFGRPAGVSTHAGKRTGPAVRFMREFARLLALKVKTESPRTAELLVSWTLSDSLGERLSDFLNSRCSMGK